MADTRADIILSPSTWTDLYAATGLVIGTALFIINKGSNTCDVAIKAVAPTDTRGLPLFAGPIGSSVQITQGESGLWAYSALGTRLFVQEF